MEVRRMKVNEINPAPYNPRIDLKPGDPEYEALKKSIERFGLVDPLIWNKRTNRLVGGHQRLKVLKDLGYETADVVVVDLPESEEKTLNIALNKIQGDWEETKCHGVRTFQVRDGLPNRFHQVALVAVLNQMAQYLGIGL